jgi:hypothetical protein
MILGHREEQIALAVVFDLRQRTLVALKENGTLLSAHTHTERDTCTIRKAAIVMANTSGMNFLLWLLLPFFCWPF